MAVESDNKKEAVIIELKAAFKDKHEKLDQEREQLRVEKLTFEAQRKEVKEEIISLKSKIEELEYYKKE